MSKIEIHFLGHAGFLVESKDSIVLMDPWVSPDGAFDSGWFQFPRNHHMADKIKNIFEINNGRKKVYVYISHEHKDHFDAQFLEQIKTYDFTYVLPSFRRSILIDRIRSISNHDIILCHDEMKVDLSNEESLTLYLDDSELNRDSAVLYSNRSFKFLNLNDCKIHDRLGIIKKNEGEVDLFAVQFSGATWHPTCYEYDEAEYKRISRKKKLSKFESTALAIENLNPKAYIPSAGPACFLDPDIIHINFQQENIFPANDQIVEYLSKRLKSKVNVYDMMPGDLISVLDSTMEHQLTQPKILKSQFNDYILNYANDYRDLFERIKQPVTDQEFDKLIVRLVQEFSDKLDNFKSRAQILRPLFIGFIDKESKFIEVNFQSGTVLLNTVPYGDNFYQILVNSYDIKRVLNGFLTWEDFSLTFRMKLNRRPDVYQVLMQGFMILQKEDLNFFCDKILEIENRNERIIVELGGIRYSIDRYCPHQGADLTYAWTEDDKYLICPRHRWFFDMEDGGKCSTNSACINALPLESD